MMTTSESSRAEDVMAICFELVVNFGQNAQAARDAAVTNPSPMTLKAGNHQIPCTAP